MAERSDNSLKVSPRSKSRPVRLEDVALHAGLGRTTVSDILNRRITGRYSAKTRERVERSVRELAYAPARAAQQLARGRSGQIGLLLTRGFSNPFFARVADVVERAARSAGYRLQIAVTDGCPETELERITQMQSDAVEGLIVGPVYERFDIEQHRNIFRGTLPIVLFGGSTQSEFDEVVLDDAAGLRLAVEHLRAYGHRRIGYLCLPPQRSQDSRSLKQSSVFADSVASDWVIDQADSGVFEEFFNASLTFARRWLAAPVSQRPTAMVCLNDQVAMTAIAALAKVGVRVPDDVSLVGFDNLPESAYLLPALTSVDNHSDSMMQQVVGRLISRIQSPGQPKSSSVIEPALVIRSSVRRLGGDAAG